MKWVAMEVRRKQSMLHLVFSEPFDTLCHSILNCKLKKYCLDKWTFWWAKTWLNCWAQRAGINDSMSSWHPTASKILQGYYSLYHSMPSSETRTMRQSILAVHFWLVLNWGSGWHNKLQHFNPEEPLNSRNGPQKPHDALQGNTEFSKGGGIISSTSTSWEVNSWVAALLKSTFFSSMKFTKLYSVTWASAAKWESSLLLSVSKEKINELQFSNTILGIQWCAGWLKKKKSLSPFNFYPLYQSISKYQFQQYPAVIIFKLTPKTGRLPC